MAKLSENSRSDLLFLINCLSIVSLLLLTSLNLETYQLKKQVLGAVVEINQDRQITDLEKEKFFWENFLAKNTLYLDGWIRLAQISDELGDKTYASTAFASAKKIDPNSEKVLSLEKEITY